MQKQVRVGIFVPIVSGGLLPSPEEFRAYCQEAERLGFESLWVNDRIFHRINVLDSLSMLTWAAAATQRVRLGTAVLLLALRSAALVAKTVSTLDFLSGGERCWACPWADVTGSLRARGRRSSSGWRGCGRTWRSCGG